jgi:hypothetical protein
MRVVPRLRAAVLLLLLLAGLGPAQEIVAGGWRERAPQGKGPIAANPELLDLLLATDPPEEPSTSRPGWREAVTDGAALAFPALAQRAFLVVRANPGESFELRASRPQSAFVDGRLEALGPWPLLLTAARPLTVIELADAQGARVELVAVPATGPLSLSDALLPEAVPGTPLTGVGEITITNRGPEDIARAHLRASVDPHPATLTPLPLLRARDSVRVPFRIQAPPLASTGSARLHLEVLGADLRVRHEAELRLRLVDGAGPRLHTWSSEPTGRVRALLLHPARIGGTDPQVVGLLLDASPFAPDEVRFGARGFHLAELRLGIGLRALEAREWIRAIEHAGALVQADPRERYLWPRRGAAASIEALLPLIGDVVGGERGPLPRPAGPADDGSPAALLARPSLGRVLARNAREGPVESREAHWRRCTQPPAPRGASVRSIRVETCDLEFGAQRGWLKLEGVERPSEPAWLEVDLDPGARTARARSGNVTAFSIAFEPFIELDPIVVEWEGQKIAVEPSRATGRFHLRRGPDGPMAGTPPPPGTKRPERAGPFPALLARRPLFVAGEGGDAEELAWARARARHDARIFEMLGGAGEWLDEGAFQEALHGARSLIVYGRVRAGGPLPGLLRDDPVRVHADRVECGRHRVTGEDLAVFTVRPHPASPTALVGRIQGTGPAGRRASDFLPWLQDELPIPDLLVLDPSLLAGDPGGVRLAGFFGPEWGVDDAELRP